jgi:sortase A
MRAKAAVASVLIARSLEATLRDGRPRPPWSWADFHPVARLEVPRLGISQPVLSGATGATLAFGLGRIDGTTLAIAGHRDTWAAFLRDVRLGDALTLQGPAGVHRYHVRAVRVVAAEDVRVLEGSEHRLILITCWPFGGLTRSRLRLAVEAEENGPECPAEKS